MADETRSPGWHPDPDDGRYLRWWNGLGWSDARRAVNAPSTGVRTPGAIPPATSVAPPQQAVDRAADAARSMQRTNAPATLGLLLAVASVFLGFLVVPGVLAIVFSLIGLVRSRAIAAAGGSRTGRNPALAGLLLGLVTTATSLAGVVAFIGEVVRDIQAG